MTTISIIIPCYRSEATIEPVVKKIKDAFEQKIEYQYQIILVNDGSPDGTYRSIKKLCQEDAQVCGVSLARNFGQEAARFAGMPYVYGDYVVYMDDDGQHDPADIFRLIEKLDEGYDVVLADIEGRTGSVFKIVTSKIHRKIGELIGNVPKGIKLSSFIACNRMVIDAAQQYHSPFPTIGAYLQCITTKFANVPVNYHERTLGTSGYSFGKLFSLWLSSFTNFSIVPLRAATLLGFVFAGIGMVVTVATIVRKLLNPAIAAGFTSMMASIYMVGGIVLLLLGLVGEYIGRIYMTVSDKPQYIIRETINTGIKTASEKVLEHER